MADLSWLSSKYETRPGSSEVVPAPVKHLHVPMKHLGAESPELTELTSLRASDVGAARRATARSDTAEVSPPVRGRRLSVPKPTVCEGWGATSTAASSPTNATAGTVAVNRRSAPRCARCRACMLQLRARKFRGMELPAFVSLLASLVLPSMDAASDWAVTLSWYASGDTSWFAAGLAIQIIGGIISGTMLAWMLRAGENDLGGGSITRTTRGGNLHICLAVPIGLVLGLIGLAPACMGFLALWTKDVNALNHLKVFKVVELVFEALPQAVLQVYVGVAFGLLDPSGADFDPLLAVSVAVSLLGAGASFTGFEALGRDGLAIHGEVLVSVASAYGVATIVLRLAQTAALVFSIALLSCAFKGSAVAAMAVSIVLYVGMGFEAMTRDQDREMQGCSNGIEACGGVCASLCGLSGYMSRRGAVVWGLLHAALVGAFAAAFFLLDHLDNNYMDDSLETGSASAPQYINCKDRLSGIYPAVGAFALSIVMLPLSLLLDPKYGLRSFRVQTWAQRNRGATQHQS